MKKVIRSIATVALMLVMAKSAAQNPVLSVAPYAKKSLVLKMDVPSAETEIKITDTEGVIMFTENTIDVKGFSKKFDLKNLPDGAYVLTVENLLKETVFEFDIDNSTAILAENKETIKPLWRKDGKRVLLNLLNTDEEEVQIIIYDSENRTLFKDELTDVVLEKAFNFENAYADNYTVMVKTKQKSYSENILID